MLRKIAPTSLFAHLNELEAWSIIYDKEIKKLKIENQCAIKSIALGLFRPSSIDTVTDEL